MGNNKLFTAWMTVLGLLMLVGIYTTVTLFREGHWLFNTNDTLVWSMPLVVYVFFALSSSGLTLLLALPTVFGVKRYTPLAKRLVSLAIATLCGGFVAIGLELGNVWNFLYIIISPNFSSPIWWMGAIYGIELVFLLIKFWCLQKDDWESAISKVAGTASFFCALIAPLMIGSVFGITESRVTYFGPVMSIYCLLTALLSGTALFVLYSMVYHKLSGNKVNEQHAVLYEEFGLIFKYAASALVVFTIVKTAIEAATVVPAFIDIRSYAHPFGSFLGFHIEVMIGLFIPFILLMIPSVRKTSGGKILIGALAWVGTLGMHMQIFIAGQSHAIGPKAEQLPHVINYYPSIWEWLVALFAMTVMLLLCTLGERYFKPEDARSLS